MSDPIREGWIHAGWLEKQQCETCKDMIFVREVTYELQPQRSEWTERYVRELSQISSGDGFLRIANSRNAALAAERETTFAAQQAALKEGIRSGELEQQLAAEQQKVQKLVDEAVDTADQEILLLRQQLAAYRGAWLEALKKLAAEREARTRAITQLAAAEQKNGDELWKNSAWKQVQQLREQLAAEKDKVDAAYEALVLYRDFTNEQTRQLLLKLAKITEQFENLQDPEER